MRNLFVSDIVVVAFHGLILHRYLLC